MDKQVVAQLLRRLQFSAELPEQMLERLAASAQVKSFPAKTVIFQEKSENDDLMIICVGRVALDLRVAGQGDVRVQTIGPGELLAWSALLGGGRMTTSAFALEMTKVVAISASELLAACEVDHSFGYFLMRRMASTLAGRLTDTRTQLVDLLTFNRAVGFSPTKQH